MDCKGVGMGVGVSDMEMKIYHGHENDLRWHMVGNILNYHMADTKSVDQYHNLPWNFGFQQESLFSECLDLDNYGKQKITRNVNYIGNEYLH